VQRRRSRAAAPDLQGKVGAPAGAASDMDATAVASEVDQVPGMSIADSTSAVDATFVATGETMLESLPSGKVYVLLALLRSLFPEVQCPEPWDDLQAAVLKCDVTS
jgi:hypothetical protein